MDHVFEKMERLVAFRLNIFGYELEIGNTTLVTWIIMALLILLALIFTKNMSAGRPGKPQVIAELLVETVSNICKGSIGAHHYKAYVPYLGTLLLYLGLANIIAIFNFIPGLELYPPTRDINVTASLALISILVVIYSGFRYKGFGGWAKSLADPMPLMIPFKLLEYGTKPLSLCLRLFGNVVAGFFIMELLLSFAPYAGAPLSAYFDLFDGILQAYIFIYLTSIYIGEAVE
ncbi:MAG: F0F1 ATP synthase subunit A [Clostridiales bacterium]|nr:F0F1 ATP synthase subunit A [Clostridiales bacterium]